VGDPRQEPTVNLLGVTFSNLTREEALFCIDRHIQEGQPGYVVTPNVDHICTVHRNDAFAEAYRHANLVLADGMPVLWASRLLGAPLREKISGSDLIVWLTEFAAHKGHSVFLFGAAEGVADAAARELKNRFPALKIAGTHCPPLGFETNPESNETSLDAIRAANPDICFVALGSPKQELWMHACHASSGARLMIGVGASFDFLSGRVRRAPRFMQTAGFEWLWRLCREPRRLWKRYLVDDLLFFQLVWRSLIKRHVETRT